MRRAGVLMAVLAFAGLVGCGTPAPTTVMSTVTTVATVTEVAPDDAVPDPTDPVADADPFAEQETDIWLPAGDHRVPGTLAMPDVGPGERVPAVLLLHGDFSDRNASADLFGRLAEALAARGIASLRIDFAGSGESEEPDLALDYPNMVADATASLDYLRQAAAVDPGKVAILGLSRGAGVGATVTGTVPGVAAFISWSGAIYDGYDEDPEGHDEARDDGYVTLDFGDRTFRLGLNWFDTIEASHPLDDVAGYTGPVLAVVGSDDDVVDPETSTVFLETVASTDTTLHVVEGADHGYSADGAYGDEAIGVTADWLRTRLG